MQKAPGEASGGAGSSRPLISGSFEESFSVWKSVPLPSKSNFPSQRIPLAHCTKSSGAPSPRPVASAPFQRSLKPLGKNTSVWAGPILDGQIGHRARGPGSNGDSKSRAGLALAIPNNTKAKPRSLPFLAPSLGYRPHIRTGWEQRGTVTRAASASPRASRSSLSNFPLPSPRPPSCQPLPNRNI